MRTRTSLVALIAAVAFTAAPAQAAKKPANACKPRGAQTAAQNPHARVFWVGNSLYACKTGGRRPIVLRRFRDRECPGRDSPVGCDNASAIRVRGRFVAVASFASNDVHGGARVDVVDVVNRASVSNWISPHDEDHSYTKVTAIELSPSGSVGMIVRAVDMLPGGSSESEVLALRGSGVSQLDTGEGIDLYSLALGRNGALYWKNGDTVRVAPLR